MAEWQDELTEAIEIAEAGGAVTLDWFGTRPDVERKADRSPVTVADRECERVMRAMIRERFPDDGILGEEAGEAGGSSGRRWILDPIDGTRSFIHGVPLYGVMVGLEVGGETVVGVLHFPALEETVAAGRGLGCSFDGEPCRVSDTPALEDALVVTSGDAAAISRRAGPGDPGLAARVEALRRVADRAGTFRTWGDCYGYALVATGRAEAMLDPVLNLWDAAAARPVIEEAGGVFTDWAGKPSHESGHVIATNVALTDAIRSTAKVTA
ncbi:MAG: inositol monophosphatase family protein [Longimicrobiales bacterium]|nr:inositol monophosphatase family protein [Longimicrobiales bacterium]